MTDDADEEWNDPPAVDGSGDDVDADTSGELPVWATAYATLMAGFSAWLAWDGAHAAAVAVLAMLGVNLFLVWAVGGGSE